MSGLERSGQDMYRLFTSGKVCLSEGCDSWCGREGLEGGGEGTGMNDVGIRSSGLV